MAVADDIILLNNAKNDNLEEQNTHNGLKIQELGVATDGYKTIAEQAVVAQGDVEVARVQAEGSTFVTKVAGKELSSNDYTDLEKTKLSDLYSKTNLDLELDKKQNATDELLETDSKNVIGGINEVNTKVINQREQIQTCLVGTVITQAEYDLLGTIVNTNGVTYIIQG